MSYAVAVMALAAGINAFRRRRELPAAVVAVVAGATLALGGYVVLAAVADDLLDALDVSAPNARIAAGLTLGLGAVLDLFRRAPDPASVPPGWTAALAPAFFPTLFRPDVGVLAISAGADQGVGAVAAGAALGLGLCVVWGSAVGESPGPVAGRVERGLGHLVAALTLFLAVDITVDGVLDV